MVLAAQHGLSNPTWSWQPNMVLAAQHGLSSPRLAETDTTVKICKPKGPTGHQIWKTTIEVHDNNRN